MLRIYKKVKMMWILYKFIYTFRFKLGAKLKTIVTCCLLLTERAEGCMGQNAILNMFLFLKYFVWLKVFLEFR